MFKNKKGGNKENLPHMSRSSLERSSSRSGDGGCEKKDVYGNNLQRTQEIHIKNPYSIVTAPKRTKGL
uniref:Uncharacterized protein n=1 Tax=Heterorhabditis bacteriophora TaxID=37862 RepID=A0A1I7XP22_HETBA